MYILIVSLMILSISGLLFINKGFISIKMISNGLLLIVLIISLIGIINIVLSLEPIESWCVAQNNDWISFWGSLLGGVFGGIATLIVISITVKDNRNNLEETINSNKVNLDMSLNHSIEQFEMSQKRSEEFHADNALKKVHPYLVCEYLSMLELDHDAKYRFYIDEKGKDILIKHPESCVLKIGNVGIASAINVQLKVDEEHEWLRGGNIHRLEDAFEMFQNLHIKPSESIEIGLCVPFREDKKEMFNIDISFSDIYKNRWSQNVLFRIDNRHNQISIFNVAPPKITYLEGKLLRSEEFNPA